MTKAKPRQAKSSAVRHANPTRPCPAPPLCAIRNAYAGLANERLATPAETHGHDVDTVAPPSFALGSGEKVAEPVKKSGTIPPSVRMQQFLYKWAAKMKGHVLEREAGPTYPVTCETCEHRLVSETNDRVYRCLDCYDPALQCASCAASSHRRNPFHRFNEWSPEQGFWGRISLGEMSGEEKLVLHFGHKGGHPCPLNRGPITRTLIVVHEHGIHKFGVRFCRCTDANTGEQTPAPVQLVRYGLWPGSWDRPETAFSMSGLRDQHLLSLQSQISTHDFVKYLERMTDNVCPEKVPDRYREYLTAAREYSFMTATKRADVEPGPNLDAGCLATMCPACPQPGINMDPKYESSGRAPDEQYLDALFHTVDGNFQHTQKTKPMDANDLPLTLGAAYYANERDFNTFQKHRPRDDKEKSTCNKFGAMGYSRYGGRVTGTVGLSCARHMFAMRMGAVDMDQGEAYAFVDFVHCSGLRPYLPLRLLVSGYDINCQYRIHFAERMRTIREKFAGLESIPKTTFPPTLIAIGKFHLPAHIPSCRFKFSYNFLPGVGMTDGEAPERIWSILDGLTSRTKEMGPGHRHDVTNDFYNDMNIRRTHNLAIELSTKLKKALLQRAESEKHFNTVTNSFTPTENMRMAAEEKLWLSEVIHLSQHKDLKNPYELNIDRGLTTKELLRDTAKARSREGGEDPGLAVLDAVYEGVELQNLREELLDALEEGTISDARREALEDARDQFITRVAQWSSAYNTCLQPALEAAAQEVVREDAEAISPAPRHVRFPLRQEVEIQPSVTAKTTRADMGLPRRRDNKDKCAMWHEVHDVVILLPSTFDARVLQKHAVASLVSWEKRVREGCANAALDDLRTHIVTSEMLKIKKMDVSGKASSTRMGKRIQHKYSEVESAAEDYRRARAALLALGMPESDHLFRPLHKSDVVKFTMTSTRADMGHSRQSVSWIWEDLSFGDRPGDHKYEAFYEDVKRVHWFRSSALVSRWKEEVGILTAEMYRCLRFHEYFRRSWRTNATIYEARGEHGAAAYSRKQAHRHETLFLKCSSHFSQVPGISEMVSSWVQEIEDADVP